MELSRGRASRSPSGGNGDAIRVAIVEDHPLMCLGIRRALGVSEDIEVVAEARTGSEAVAMLAEVAPDVVLLDYTLPDTDAVGVMREARAAGCRSSVVVLTCHTDEHRVRLAIDAGASGFLIKTSVDAESLSRAIRDACRGQAAVSPEMLSSLVRVARHDVPGSPERLTEREHEVWHMMAEGLSNREIATRLCVSERTVKFHVSNVLRKTGTRSRAEATALAFRQGEMGPSA